MAETAELPVVVVGGGLAGSRTCVELRKQGYAGPIVLLGDEALLPYDRPPLSKAVLRGKYEPKPLKVDYEGLGIDLRMEVAATALDAASRLLLTTAGPLEFSHLVIATGARPIRLPGSGEQMVLRTKDDSIALRDRLGPGVRVVVVGASWIGAEVAHAALVRGCQVIGIEFHPAPLAQALGPQIGARFASWWAQADLRTSESVVAIEPDGVHLASGEVVAGDVVVTGVGVRPATQWLVGSGLDLQPAVAVDEHLRTSQPAIYALGDAAAWWSRRFDRRIYAQHWDDAYSAPAVVAGQIVGTPGPAAVHDPVPYFWSDQFGHRVEYVGCHDPADLVTVDENLERGWTARWTDVSGASTAALAVDQPKLIAGMRAELASHTSTTTQPPSIDTG